MVGVYFYLKYTYCVYKQKEGRLCVCDRLLLLVPPAAVLSASFVLGD